MSRDRRVVITGIGPITSIGIGKNALWENLVQGNTNIKLEETYVNGELWGKFYFHKVEGFDVRKFGIDEDELDFVKDWKEGEENVDLNYLLAAVKLALDDSGLNYNSENNGISIVLMHENMNLIPFLSKVSERAFDMLTKKSDALTKKQFYEKLYSSCLKSGYDVQTFMTLFHVGRVFKIHEYSLVINNACASGLYAIETASEMIKSNQNSIVVIAASDHPDIYKYLWFRDMDLYAEDGIVRPFSRNSKGLVFGDGGVALVMEDLGHAQKRGAPIYGEYLGGGFSLESWRVTMPQVGSDFYQKAVLKAFEQSKIDRDEIDLLCVHGVGADVIDAYEAKAITDICGLNFEKPLITTFKPHVGHNLGGSTLLETAVLLLSFSNNLVLPTLNCEDIDPKFNISLVKEKVKAQINIAMKMCCAFAGYNAAVIFKKA